MQAEPQLPESARQPQVMAWRQILKILSLIALVFMIPLGLFAYQCGPTLVRGYKLQRDLFTRHDLQELVSAMPETWDQALDRYRDMSSEEEVERMMKASMTNKTEAQNWLRELAGKSGPRPVFQTHNGTQLAEQIDIPSVAAVYVITSRNHDHFNGFSEDAPWYIAVDHQGRIIAWRWTADFQAVASTSQK